MPELNDVFSTAAETAPATPETSANNAAKKAKIEAMKKSLKETINSDPTFTQRLHSLSGSLEVVKSLGFGENGNIVVDHTKTDAENRALTTTSAIIGYRVRNIGSEPIKYVTEEYSQGEDGKYVGAKVEKFLNPGETADLNRQYMTMLCAIPEISFTLANGKVIRGSGRLDGKDMKAELEAYYFTFNKDLGLQVNSDAVKLQIGEKVGDKWQVKPEFVAAFGYLNNAPEKARAGRKSEGGAKYTASDLAANYVMQMLKDASL